MENKFNRVINLPIIESYLGDYDSNNLSITLYDVPNNQKELNKIKQEVGKVTNRFRLVALSPKDNSTNIKLLDIGLWQQLKY